MKCTKCKQNKLLSEFNYKIKANNLRHRQCRDCTRRSVKNHYNNNKLYYLRKTKIRNDKIRKEMTNYIRGYLLNNPCVDCGERDLAVLEFDHNGKLPKVKAVSSLVRASYPLEIIIEEIGKCDVRCANCHRRKTAKQFKWHKLSDMPL